MRPAIPSASLLACVLALSGCGGGGGGGTSTQATASTQTTAQTATETTTSETTTKPTQMRIVVAGGVPKGGITRTTVAKGDDVVVLVTSDVADEVHVHGYDLKADVAPAKPARIAFVAKIPGRFEIELESRGLQIGDLTVQ